MFVNTHSEIEILDLKLVNPENPFKMQFDYTILSEFQNMMENFRSLRGLIADTRRTLR